MEMEKQNRNVAIVGVGLIGRAWAAIFARAGWNVRLTDPHQPTLKSAPGLIREELQALARHGLADDPDGAAARLSIAASLKEAVDGVEFVQENGPEIVDQKIAIFAELDKLAPPDAVDRARKIYSEIGQVPVTINREINGFVLNRLQGALLAEAFRLVGEGFISAEDLDHTVKDGLGLRWSFLGPFETIELNAPGGIPDYCARYTGFYKELASASPGPEVYQSPNIDRVIAAWPHRPTPERIAALTQRRNERLAALAAHKANQNDKS